MKNLYRVPVVWSVESFILIQAEDEDEAILLAENTTETTHSEEPTFVSGSWYIPEDFSADPESYIIESEE